MESIQLEVSKIEEELDRFLKKAEWLANFLDKGATATYILAAIGMLISIFSHAWIGLLSLAVAIVGIVFQISKHKMNLSEKFDIHLWISVGCATLSDKCAAALAELRKAGLTQETALSHYHQQLDEIKSDLRLYRDGVENERLNAHLLERYERSRHSAAMKNKYNKHEIKQFLG